MIEVAGLGRRFGAVEALRNLTFTVAPGEIVGFLGPNGAGKTTAMRILTCTLPPTAGRATVAGHDIVTEALAVRRRLGFMPENVPLYTDCTVDELLRFVAGLKEVPARATAAAVDGVVRRAGLLDVRGRLVGHLSKGFRQRVGLAQALLGEPPVLILDEPSSGLDPQQIVEIRELIRGFAGEKTVLLSSHILNEVSLICGRVLILDRGRLVGEADPRALTPRQDGLPRVVVSWDGPREAVCAALAAVRGVSGVAPSAGGAEVTLAGDPETVRPDLAAAVIGAGGRLQRLEDRGATLEELFLSLTAEHGAPGLAPPVPPAVDNGREAAP
ncbi:MAG: ABC transporter ATP-binding protein [Candidatus Krumholzibacteriia bacterium]